MAIQEVFAPSNVLAIIGTEVALAGYLSAVKQRVLDRLDPLDHVLLEEKRREYQQYLIWLTGGDMLVILSALSLTGFLLFDISALRTLGVTFLFTGLGALVLLHVNEWYKSLSRISYQVGTDFPSKVTIAIVAVVMFSFMLFIYLAQRGL